MSDSSLAVVVLAAGHRGHEPLDSFRIRVASVVCPKERDCARLGLPLAGVAVPQLALERALGFGA
ncbi:MAG: hypothetical protein NWP95_01450 [Pontimonas sp.]|nr:hypothetical protein [Pontimonas sp.]